MFYLKKKKRKKEMKVNLLAIDVPSRSFMK